MADLRNVVAHTAFGPHDSGAVEFLTIKAKGKLTFPEMIWSDTQFHEYCNKMGSLREKLEEVTEKLHRVRIMVKLANALSKQQQQPQGLLNALIPHVQSFPDSPESSLPTDDQGHLEPPKG